MEFDYDQELETEPERLDDPVSSPESPLWDAKEKKRRAKRSRFYFWIGLACGMLIAACIVAGMRLYEDSKIQRASLISAEPGQTKPDDSFVTKTTQEKMKLLEDCINEYYLDDVKREDLETGIYQGMVEALGDPYSTYYTVDELEKLKESTEGIYYGIGAYVGLDSSTNYCKITEVIPNTPAQKAGLKAEDIIYEVDGKSTYEMTTSDVVDLIRGEENTDVILTIVRKGERDYLHITVTRGAVESPTVDYEMMDDHVAYIRIRQFDTVTSGQFSEALAKARSGGMASMILDLRNNPGGTLESVVKIAQELLPKGLIVYTEDKNGRRKEYTCDGEHEIDVPMVVLVNDNSASAAEILAGAIKDYKVGTLVGTTTFGKGIVQRVFGITDGSAVKLTVSHYYTPYGNDIHKVGIAPDEELELDYDAYLDDGIDNQLERAVEILTGKKNE